ncbi:MAG: hypothetical protein LBO00_07075 [Zoogloeaceae bacterium]|jgi:hypothetical protein|nr:hypothetical protein [Zoogloeaceae bacterium]
MDYTLEYEVNDAGLMNSARRLATRLARNEDGGKTRWRRIVRQEAPPVLFGLVFGIVSAFFSPSRDFLFGLFLGLALGVLLMFLILFFDQRAIQKRSLSHMRGNKLILDDAGLCLRSAFGEVRCPWREVRDLLPQRGWLAIVLTPLPMIIPIPDRAFADAAARQAFLDVLREGMSSRRAGDEEMAYPHGKS